MKKRQQGGGAVKKVISLTQNLSVSIFSANQFLLHFIPRGCVNICNNKKTHNAICESEVAILLDPSKAS